MSRDLSDARLYAIVDLGYTAVDEIESTAQALVDGGADILQLRAKGHEPPAIEAMACRLLPICREAGVPFIINDHPAIAAAAPFDLIVAHNFLNFFAPQPRAELVRHWHALLRPGGRVVMVGMPHSGDRARIEPVIHALLQQGFQGSMMGETVLARDIPWIVDLWRQGRLQLEALVSRTWALEEIDAAIADTRAGAARRNVIVFPDLAP